MNIGCAKTEKCREVGEQDQTGSVHGGMVGGGLRRTRKFLTSAVVGSINANGLEDLGIFTQAITLEPGDVIATGTPAGVGHFRDPPRYLKPGDRLRLEVERVGVLEHSIG